MEAAGYYDQLSFVKKAENPEYVVSLLYPDLIQSIGSFQMFEIGFRNLWKFFNYTKDPYDFIFHFLTLFYKERLKIVLVKSDGPVFGNCWHKYKDVVRKDNYLMS